MSDLQFFSSAALTVVLGIAGVAKLRAPGRFRSALQSYRLVPAPMVTPLVYVVPALELSLAALGWVPALQPRVAIVVTVLFGAFTLLLLASLLGNDDADCGCFGTAAPEKVSWFSIVRNGALIAISGAPVAITGPSIGARAPAALAGIGVGLLILVLDQALTLLARPAGARSRS